MKRRYRIIFSITAVCILSGSVCLALLLITPPPPLPATAPAEVFSASRAMQDLEIIAQKPHPMGVSPAHAAVRDYILGEIQATGLEPQVQDTIGVRVVQSGWVIAGAVENILVRLRGTDPDGAILLSSHYDSTPGGPGAGDSGSGIVTVLELMRAIKAGPPLRHDVIFFFSDGEEPGTIGAHAFVSQHPWSEDVEFAINMDQVTEGPPMLIRSSQGNGDLVHALAKSTPSTRPAYVSFPFDLFPGGDTDLLPFTLAAIPGAEIDAGGSFPEKHTTLDLPDVVDPGSIQQAGNQMLALVRYLGDQPTLRMGFPDQSFFPMLGLLVHYPSRLAWPFTLLAGSCFLGIIFYGTRRRALTWRATWVSSLTLLLSLGISVITSHIIWRGILAAHPEYAYVSAYGYRQKLSDDFLYAVGFIALALAFMSAWIAVVHKKVSTLELAAGALIVYLAWTIAMTILLPATSYLSTWVLLANSLALLLALTTRSRKHAWIITGMAFMVSAIVATFLWIPLLYIAILAGPMSPGTPLLSILLAAAALWLGSMAPLLDLISRPGRWPLPLAAALVALGFLLSGHSLVGHASPPPLVNPVGYWFDIEQDQAYWIAFSDELDDRQREILENAVRQAYTDLLSEAPGHSVQTSPAPLLDLQGPQLEVIGDEWLANRRVVQVRFTSSMHDRVYIIIPREIPVLAFTLQNNERVKLDLEGSNEWVLRFDGMPVEGIELSMEFSETGPIRILLVEERTGLPTFPGLSTEPKSGTMKSPGEFYQGIPTDFTVIKREHTIQGLDPSWHNLSALGDAPIPRNGMVRIRSTNSKTGNSTVARWMGWSLRIWT